jgi:hypothetical protein
MPTPGPPNLQRKELRSILTCLAVAMDALSAGIRNPGYRQPQRSLAGGPAACMRAVAHCPACGAVYILGDQHVAVEDPDQTL